ncbi:hypothetical protein MPSEU_000334400 [Mayamaea pseudoterrestris]|nr:hypothetical protein MPSEU_000334400 [Mayamaea pseudoterrestris]
MMQRNMLPHRLEENLSFCPRDVTTYAALHLDSMAKILNHLLILLFVLNMFLFLSCWSQSISNNNTLPLIWMSLFLILQNATVWAILNNGRLSSSLSFLSPNDFIMGVALGITIGASILSFVLSQSFKYGTCSKQSYYGSGNRRSDGYDSHENTTERFHDNGSSRDAPIYCNRSTSVWLWAGLVFWVNFCACLLLAVGRREFSSQLHADQYEPVGTVDPMYTTSSGYNNSSRPSATFAGDYANVPEMRQSTDDLMGSGSSHSVSSTRSADATAKILSV